MKKKSTSQSAFFNLRVLIGAFLCLGAVAVALFGAGVFAQTRQSNRSATAQDAPGTQSPDVVQLVGPVVLNMDIRNLPYIPPNQEIEERRLTRYPRPDTQPSPDYGKFAQSQSLLKNIFQPTPAMPAPLLTFDGINSAQSGCGCFPPDTNGDVGPNHYVESTNSSFKVFDKNGNTLAGPTTFNSFFAPLGNSTPCGANQNFGDPFVMYDQVADRWIVSDFAFPGIPSNGPFYQCIGVSQSPDPVAGPWALYAVQHDSGNPAWVGDYPKFALWNNPQPGGAYFLTVNLFHGSTLAFEGVGVFAFDRASMLAGGPTNAIHFDIPSRLGRFLLSSGGNFRAGNPPPVEGMSFCLSMPGHRRRGFDPGARLEVSCRFSESSQFNFGHRRQSQPECPDHS